MNIKILRFNIGVCAVWLLLVHSAFAQGPLTPPGPPAPTMKTLDQVEARTPITNATAVTISASGSYYLTTNINVESGDAITITANGVTLDLNGFTISTTAGNPSGRGILMAGGNTDITILNGHIAGDITYSGGVYSGGGFESGIEYLSPVPSNVRVAGVSVRGCYYDGIHLNSGNSTVVESCTVQNIGGLGIWAASVSRSTAYQCGSYAIYANTASDCYGYATDNGSGLVASTAHNCYGVSSNGTGLSATSANNCYGQSFSGNGVYASTANNCYGQSSSASAMVAGTANNCYGQSFSGTGVYGGNIAIGCLGFSFSGTGLYAYIANSCRGSSGSGTPISYSFHYNMPPNNYPTP